MHDVPSRLSALTDAQKTPLPLYFLFFFFSTYRPISFVIYIRLITPAPPLPPRRLALSTTSSSAPRPPLPSFALPARSLNSTAALSRRDRGGGRFLVVGVAVSSLPEGGQPQPKLIHVEEMFPCSGIRQAGGGGPGVDRSDGRRGIP